MFGKFSYIFIRYFLIQGVIHAVIKIYVHLAKPGLITFRLPKLLFQYYVIVRLLHVKNQGEIVYKTGKQTTYIAKFFKNEF